MFRKFWVLPLLLVMPVHAQAAEFIGQPQKICQSLENVGIFARGGWKTSNAFPGEYLCMSDMVEFGPQGKSGIANNIALYVNGKQPDRADDITVKININHEAGREVALNRLLEATETLMSAFNLSAPPEIEKAI